MKNILTIIKKELLRVFKDKRLLITLLLPGIMIYAMYSIMGDAMNNMLNEGSDAQYKIYAANMPDSVKTFLEIEELEFSADYFELDESVPLDDNLELLKNKEADIIIIFDADFEAALSIDPAAPKPDVQIYYNDTESTSSYAFQKLTLGLQLYERGFLSAHDVQVSVFTQSLQSVADENAAAAKGFSMLIPMLLMVFLFSGCMAVAPESISGEKERGTIATILITPIKRSELALGKVLALSILSILSAASSFIGLLFSLPKLVGADMSIGAIYGFGEFALLFLVLVATVLLIVGVMAIISTFAKSIKEATMLIMPFMLIATLIGITSMISGGAATSALLYLIPLYNSVQAITAILTFSVNIPNLLITFFANLVAVAACVYVVTRLFNNEKVMFSK